MDRLEQVLESLNIAAVGLKELTVQAQAAIKRAEDRAIEVEKKLVGMTEREEAVLQREVEVAHLVRQYAGFGELVVAQNKLADELSKFENRVTAFNKDESARLAKVVDGESSNTAMRLALKKDREALELEKKNYRQQIMDEIKKKVGG